MKRILMTISGFICTLLLCACSPDNMTIPRQDNISVSMDEPEEYISSDVLTRTDTEDEITSSDTHEFISENNEYNASCEVHYIDVGQGDSTLIISEGEAMLIDAGDNSCGTKIRNYLSKQGVDQLKYLILTHPDADHIGGAASVIEKIPIGEVFMPQKEHTSKTYENTMNAISYMTLKTEMPQPGSMVTLGSCDVTFYGPISLYDDNNNCSIVCKLSCGQKNFLFVGDAEEDELHEVISSFGNELSSDVYKAGHHGSYNSSTQELLDAVQPEYAVISCGEGNDYGHPHAEPMNRFLAMGIHVFRTDMQGSVVISCQDDKITYDASPCDDYSSGDGIKKDDRDNNPELENRPDEINISINGYVINTNSGKFHRYDCDSVSKISDNNREETDKTKEELINEGYVPCRLCNP